MPADDVPVTPTTRPVPSLRERSSVRPGFSPELFDRLWTITDIADFADVSERQAWTLIRHPDAPPRLHFGTRTVRWDPTAVVEYLLSRTKGARVPAVGGPGRTPTLKVAPDPDRVTVITPRRPQTATTIVAKRPSRTLNQRGGRA